MMRVLSTLKNVETSVLTVCLLRPAPATDPSSSCRLLTRSSKRIGIVAVGFVVIEVSVVVMVEVMVIVVVDVMAELMV